MNYEAMRSHAVCAFVLLVGLPLLAGCSQTVAIARDEARHGPSYYHFVYRNVLFMVLDSEDSPRPQPPAEIKEATKVYKRLQVEDPEAAKKMLTGTQVSKLYTGPFPFRGALDKVVVTLTE